MGQTWLFERHKDYIKESCSWPSFILREPQALSEIIYLFDSLTTGQRGPRDPAGSAFPQVRTGFHPGLSNQFENIVPILPKY